MEESLVKPVLFVVDHEAASLGELLSDLSRRFGTAFEVRGECTSAAALASLREVAAAGSARGVAARG